MPRKSSIRHRAPSRGDAHVAIVHTVDRVCFVAHARTRPGVRLQIARYVAEHAQHQLAPACAQRVQSLIDAGDLDGGIAHYFANTGTRWDEQWLVTIAVNQSAVASAAAALGRMTGAGDVTAEIPADDFAIA